LVPTNLDRLGFQREADYARARFVVDSGNPLMPTQPTTRRAPLLHTVRSHRNTRRVSCPTLGQCFDIEVSREVDGWLIRIPEIGGVTRASRRATVELAARKCIATKTGIPIGYVAVLVHR
jgi:hypothetical protein